MTKTFAAMPAKTVFEIPLVAHAGNRIPDDGVIRVRVDVVDQRRDNFAIVRHQPQPGMRGELRRDGIAQHAPTAEPVQRVERLEFDQAQHDEVQEVFAVPGGCILVRADLFEALGLDPAAEIVP